MISTSAADDPAARLTEANARLAAQASGRPPTGRTHDDADDDAGTAAADDAVGFDPIPLLRALDDSGARVTVIGQVAGILHGSQELTGDLDLLWDGDPAQAEPLAAAFGAAAAELTDDDGAPVPCAAATFRLPKLLFRTARASGDCCTTALNWGDLPVADFLARPQVAPGPGGFTIRYLALDDLVRMRRAVGRVKDLRRASELEELGRRRPAAPPAPIG